MEKINQDEFYKMTIEEMKKSSRRSNEGKIQFKK